jgi:hypothetical protein
MDEKARKASQDDQLPSIGETFEESERLLTPFFRTSAIGFAILDRELRYQAINPCLARINGIPVSDHLGVRMRDLFGEIGEKLAAAYYSQVLDRAQSSHFEVKNFRWPARGDSPYWAVNTNFPIKDRTGKVKQMGILVVEVTQQRELDKLIRELTGTPHGNTEENISIARELHQSVEQYDAALAQSLETLVGQRDKSLEALTQSVEALDRRIVTMDKLVTAVASSFPCRNDVV